MPREQRAVVSPTTNPPADAGSWWDQQTGTPVRQTALRDVNSRSTDLILGWFRGLRFFVFRSESGTRILLGVFPTGMPDRVTSDNPSVETVDATLERYGGTRRLQVVAPADAREKFPEEGEIVRLVVDDNEYRARVGETNDGRAAFRGAYDTPSLARSRDGTNHLREWLASTDLDVGRTIHVDIVVPDFKYGVRAPGETARYTATEKPNRSLADIARDLDG